MDKLKNSDSEKLIKKAFSLLKSGEKAKARILAKKAADLSPDNEQAWLILASLSKSDQALFFLENALRANPESEAAKKGIRVIFEEMATKSKKAEAIMEKPVEYFGETEPPVRLEDTSPIPIIPVQPETSKAGHIESDQKPQEEISTPAIIKQSLKKKMEKAKDSKPEFIPPPGPTSEEKKDILRKKLAKPEKKGKAAAADPESQHETKKKIRKVRLKKTKIKAKEPIKPVETPPEEIQKPEEQPITQKTRGKTSADSIEIKTTTDEIQPSAMADYLSRAFSKNQPEQGHAIDQKPEDVIITPGIEEIPQEKPVEAKLDVEPKVKAETKSLPIKKKQVKKQPAKQSRKIKMTVRTGNVDIIEIILMSLAAIALPILAFLYFFLKN